jgi:cell wall-associated NlpC family hydrolase
MTEWPSTLNEKRYMILKKIPFLRPRHDGTLVSPETLDSSSRSVSRTLTSGHSLALFGVLCLASAPHAVAAPKKLVGVQAWTSGSTTSIRVRPTNDTPVVAKVSRHMPLYVWGKYNGWYRVETHDHLFGWVQHPYIKSPNLHKVVAMSAAKANEASKRTDNQVVFGTQDQLKKFYISTGSEGARKGLALQGIYVKSPKDLLPTRTAKVVKVEPKVQVAAKPAVKPPAVKPPVVITTASASDDNSGSSRLLSLRNNVLSNLSDTKVPQSAPKPNTVVRSAPVSLASRSAKAAVAPKPEAKAAAKPAQKPLTWKQKRWMAQAAAKQKQRDQLRTKVGLAAKPIAPASVASLPVVSQEELLAARNAYLQARQQRQAATVANPEPLADAQLGGQIAPASPARITPSSFDGSAAQSGIMLIDHEVAAESENALVSTVTANAQLKPKSNTAVANRGGSPRDRARANLGNGIANQALSYRGMRYVYGSANPKRGFDCSGLVYFMLRQRGLNPPRTAAGYRNYGSAVSRNDLQKGDLVLFANTYKRGISHIGIYLGNNNFVHAATTGSGVRVDSLTSGYYAKKYHSARRVK